MASFERCVVLVADDEPPILRIVTHVLTRHGYEVISAQDGRSALSSCLERDGPVHLALLDIMMPEMTGPELAECLKHHDPKIEVVFMSGYGAEHIASIAPGLTIDRVHFIPKPFLPRDIVQRVNEILGNTDICILPDEEIALA